jgi:hypothetical protein
MRRLIARVLTIAALATLAVLAAGRAAQAQGTDSSFTAAPADSTPGLRFTPYDSETVPESADSTVEHWHQGVGVHWPRAPYGEGLLTGIAPWAAEHRQHGVDMLADYNRVDALRLGLGWRMRGTEPWMPRLGARIEQVFGRQRTNYGAQFEQPIQHNGRFAIGAFLLRRTDRNDLQQIGDLDNSLSMLFSHYDFRDYFEREGAGAYLLWRVPDFSNISVHVQNNRYRSLDAFGDLWAISHGNRPLAPNPAIDDGEGHSLLIRLENAVPGPHGGRPGFSHWIEIDRAAHGMGGDFDYVRAIADLRGVIRLSPTTSLALRGVAGHTPDGTLPRQKEFTLGGPDGLRAHPLDAFRGNRAALGQAEYDVSLWRVHGVGGGLHALAFTDVGTAWNASGSSYDLAHQKMAVDGGFGLALSDNSLNVCFARDLQDFDKDFSILVRFERPF